MNKILSVFTTHQNDMEQLKRKGVEIIGYARKSPHPRKQISSQELQRRFNNLQNMSINLLQHSKCDQIFVSDSSNSSTSLTSRDHNSDFPGNTIDMLAYISTVQHDLCLVVLDYAGLSSRGALVKDFLEQHPSIKKVVIDLYNAQHKMIILDAVTIIKDPTMFDCRKKLVNRSLPKK